MYFTRLGRLFHGDVRPLRNALQQLLATDTYDVGQVGIDILPGDVLLEVFDFYVQNTKGTNRWMTLVHVCQRWRNIVFGSTLRLDLQLVCTNITPVRTLNVWPPLPIIVKRRLNLSRNIDDILATFKHYDRICKITLADIRSSQWKKVLPTMQEQFPALKYLKLASSKTPLVAADPILGGSAPRLQVFSLDGISFRGLPKLLLSTTDLVVLDLFNIPHSGYISPEAMVKCLSALTRLTKLLLKFESPRSRPDRERRRPPPPTRSVLPTLASFVFKGVSEYLEDLVSGIDAPQLSQLAITFFHQLIFDTPQLTQFISRMPTLMAHDLAQARLVFCKRYICVIFPRALGGVFRIGISCIQSDWQLSALAQLCISSFPQILIPTVEHLYIIENAYHRHHWQDDIENSQWLEILPPFTAVKNLYLSKELVPRVAPSLQGLVGVRVTESLPALQGLHLEEGYRKSQTIEKAISKFVGARWLAMSYWQRDRPSWSFGIPDVYPTFVFFEE